jgi:hypothetical protein
MLDVEIGEVERALGELRIAVVLLGIRLPGDTCVREQADFPVD